MTTHIYRRVSTLGQAGDDKSSLADQDRRCRGAAMILGTDEPLDWCDAGVSGGTPLTDRRAGGRMLEALRPGDFVIAAKLDRIFRSASDALANAESFQARGIHLVLLDCGTEPVTKGTSKLFFSILAAVAEFEKGRILERMSDGRRAKRARGGHIGGDTPYGWRLDAEGVELIPVETEQKAVEFAKRLRIGSMLSFRQIAGRLEEDGYLPRNGKSWEAMQVKRMIEK